MQNDSSVGANASSIQPTLVPSCYRGPQHCAQSLDLDAQKFTKMLEERKKIAKWAQCWSWCLKHPANFEMPSLARAPILSSIHWAIRIEIHQNGGQKKIKMQNDSSVGANASSIQPTLVPSCYRGPQHCVQSIDLDAQKFTKMLGEKIKCKMSLVLELVHEASNQLKNPPRYRGPQHWVQSIEPHE
jgi:hypothetical protein